jgi:hypothetical protein
MLSNLDVREIPLHTIRILDDKHNEFLLTDSNNSLNKMQEEQAGLHWERELIRRSLLIRSQNIQ